MKEIRFSTSIESHDETMKLNKIQKYLKSGNPVKVEVRMKNFWEFNETACSDKLNELLGQLEPNSYKMTSKPQAVTSSAGVVCQLAPVNPEETEIEKE